MVGTVLSCLVGGVERVAERRRPHERRLARV